MTVLQDEGSLVGVAGHRHATHLVYMGLMAMQHRASAGVGLACRKCHLRALIAKTTRHCT